MKNDQTTKNTIDSPTEPLATPPSSSPLVPSRGDNKKRWFIGGAILLSLILIIGMAVWSMQSAPRQQASEDQKVTLTPAEEIVGDVSSELQKGVVFVDKVTQFGGQTDDNMLAYDFAPYQPQGASYKVIPSKGYGKGVTVITDEAGTLYTRVATRLAEKGFTEKSVASNDAGGLLLQQGEKLVAYAVYTSRSAVCSLARVDVSEDFTGEQLLGVGCADIADYEAAATAIQPFYAARGTDAPLLLGVPEIKEGADGYKRGVLYERTESGATTTISSAGLYYLLPGSKNWTYFMSTENGSVACAAYNSEALKKAFKDIGCYDAATKSTRTVN